MTRPQPQGPLAYTPAVATAYTPPGPRSNDCVHNRIRPQVCASGTPLKKAEALRHFWNCADQLQTERRTHVPTG